ncbi:MAG: hypothetical protein ACK46E_05730 [Pseudanabaena sp.]
MQKQRPLSAVGLWWRWVLATFVGTVIGNILGIPACLAGIYYLSDYLTELKICHTGFGSLTCPVTTGIVSGSLVVGVFVGLMQYLVLRRLLRSSAWWIIASTFGWTCIGSAATSLAYTAQFGFVIGEDGVFAESNIIDRLPVLVIHGLWLVFAGLLLGVLQWLILWNGVGNTVPKQRLFWWIVVNVTLVFFSAITIVLIFRGMGSLRGILWFFLGFTPIYATITGAALAKMRLHRQAKVEETQPALALNHESNEISESL